MEENKLKQIKLTATFLNTDSIIERENNLDGFEKIKGEYYTHDN